MIHDAGCSKKNLFLALLVLALAAGAGSPRVAAAQTTETPAQFWHIPVWAFPGAWQDAPDTIREQTRTVTVRLLRSRRVEARSDFGGYRIYRVVSTRDTSRLMLVRRYSVSDGDERLWHFSRVDPASLEFMKAGRVVHDSVLTFVDPDSSGAFEKVCRRVDALGRCLTPRDSIWALVAPPGPHDGFRTWYAVTYEARNALDNNYEDLFVPDTSGGFARCGTVGDTLTCPNLNSKAANLLVDPVEPTGGPAANTQAVAVVPNPFRGSEAWDQAGGYEVHFVNLPPQAKIQIYTVAGDLVRELTHSDPTRDFERWDLKNAQGLDVSSGLYVYRVEAGAFFAQNRFVVIR